ERALGFFVGLRNLFLHLGGGLFHLGREPHVAIVLHASAGGDEPSDNDVFLQSTQVVDRALNGCFGQHARCLLERRRRNERVRRERSLGDAQQQWPARRRTSSL